MIFLSQQSLEGAIYCYRNNYPIPHVSWLRGDPLKSPKTLTEIIVMTEPKSTVLDKRAKRNREIAIRVNDYELAEIKKRNRENTVASWLRGLALGVTPVKPVDPELVRQLGRIGSNLNQLTKHVNSEKQVDAEVLSEIKAIREQLHVLIEASVEYSKVAARDSDDC